MICNYVVADIGVGVLDDVLVLLHPNGMRVVIALPICSVNLLKNLLLLHVVLSDRGYSRCLGDNVEGGLIALVDYVSLHQGCQRLRVLMIVLLYDRHERVLRRGHLRLNSSRHVNDRIHVLTTPNIALGT